MGVLGGNGDTDLAGDTLVPQDLQEALDLRATPDEGLDEGYPLPTQLALANADRILRRMPALFPTRLDVYPTPDGEGVSVHPPYLSHKIIKHCLYFAGLVPPIHIVLKIRESGSVKRVTATIHSANADLRNQLGLQH